MPVKSKKQRGQLGRGAGIIVLLVNAFLFVGKYLVGLQSGSSAIKADAVNNLSDMATAAIMLIGFQLALRPRDREHPQGHGRAEYVSGLVISLLIIMAGLTLGWSTISQMLHPEPIVIESLWVILIPAVAVGVKLGLAIYLYLVERQVHSATVKATLIDSCTDAGITALTLLTLWLTPLTSWPLDGLVALGVTGLILYNGVGVFGANASLLLGRGLSLAATRKLSEIVDAYSEFEKITSIITNDFGPEETIVVLQLKPNKKCSTRAVAAAADKLSARLSSEFSFQVVVYWRG